MAFSVMDFPCWNVSWGTAANNWESCATALGLDWPPLKVFTYVIGSMRVAMRATVSQRGSSRAVSRAASRRLHPTQVVEELLGGGSHLRLRLSCLHEIQQYELSWGGRMPPRCGQES